MEGGPTMYESHSSLCNTCPNMVVHASVSFPLQCAGKFGTGINFPITFLDAIGFN